MRRLGHVLASVVALTASVAQADKFPIDRWKACAPHFETVGKKDYAHAAFTTPSSGGTGIFVVRKAGAHGALKAGEAIKFLKFPNPGVAYARVVLDALHLPHDQLIAYEEDEEKVTEARDLVVKAGADGKFQNVQANDLATRLGRITMRDDGNPGAPAAMLRTGLVTLAGEGETLLSMLDAVGLNPNNIDRKANDLMLAVRALQDPANQQFLGALFIADLMLGNGDRMSKASLGQWTVDSPNWNNIVVGVAPAADAAPCLVAIDNEAVAPSAKQAVFDKAVQAHPNGGANISVTLTADQVLEALVRRNVDDSLEIYGPAVAFEGPLQGVLSRCGPRPAGAGVVSDLQLGRIVASLKAAIRRGAGTMSMTVIDGAPPSPPGCAMSVQYQPPGGRTLQQGIDWSAFERNFDLGVAHAVKHFAKDQPNSTLKAVGTHQSVVYEHQVKQNGLDRLSREGMHARIAFLQHIVGDPQSPRSAAAALGAMKADRKLANEPFMQQQRHVFISISDEPAWGRMLHD